MQYKIEYSSIANHSLNEIYDYISNVLLSPKAAENTVLGIIRTVNSLNELPRRYKVCDEKILKDRNIRSVNYKNYKILYFIDEKSCSITIANIFYLKRNTNNIII